MSDTSSVEHWEELQGAVSSILQSHKEGRVRDLQVQVLADIITPPPRQGSLAASRIYLATRNMTASRNYLATRNMAPVLGDIINGEALSESSHRQAIQLLFDTIEGGAEEKKVDVTESLLNALWKAWAHSSLQQQGAETFRILASEYDLHRRLRKYFDGALVTKHHDLLQWTDDAGPAIDMLKAIYQIPGNDRDLPERGKTGKLDLLHTILRIVDMRISRGCIDATAETQNELMPMLNHALLMGRGEDEMVGGLACKLLTRFCTTQESINGGQVLGGGFVPHVVQLISSSNYVVAIRALKCIVMVGRHGQTSALFIKSGAFEEITQMMHTSGFRVVGCIALKTIISTSPSPPPITSLLETITQAVSLLRGTTDLKVKLCVLSLLIAIAKIVACSKEHANEIIDGILSLMAERPGRNLKERLLLDLGKCVDAFEDQVFIRRLDITNALQQWDNDYHFDMFSPRLREILDWRY